MPQLMAEGKTQDEIRHALEMLVRAYDTCISCSTHLVKVEFKIGLAGKPHPFDRLRAGSERSRTLHWRVPARRDPCHPLLIEPLGHCVTLLFRFPVLFAVAEGAERPGH